MTSHELARQLLAKRDLLVTFSIFDGPYGLWVYTGVSVKNVVHEVIEHDEPEDFIEIMLAETA